MEKRITYHQQNDAANILRLREILNTLPPFCKDYFRAVSTRTSTKTRISYAYDLRTFFQYLTNEDLVYQGYQITEFTLDMLDSITSLQLEEYVEYLKVYRDSRENIATNGERGLKRKLSALRSLYLYFFRHEMLKNNPTLLVDMPKQHDKAIIRLEPDEVACLLDYIENCGNTLTGQRKVYYEKTKERDLAIVTLMLGTGIRVSECVGLDIEDVDFRNNGIKVFRKGGKEMVVYFGDEVEKALQSYLNIRKTITPKSGQEHALFYSTRNSRIGIQAVENLVKKYAMQITTLKKITPHKLRSTYGTNLYRETGDIYLVADVLGHEDVNTTKKHYAAIEDDRRRKAASIIKLRENRKEDGL